MKESSSHNSNAVRFRSATAQGVCLLLCAVLFGEVHAQEPAATPDQINFFETKIRPVLVEHCYECHAAGAKIVQGGLRVDHRAGLLRGGDTGAAIVPGDAEKSSLLAALRYEDVEMPPKGKLADSVIKDFEAWIAMGAPDPREAVTDPPIRSIDFEEGRKHWAFQPVTDPQLPAVRDESWPLDPLDRFILARLEAAGLKPVAEANRHTWLRRVSLDLTGLPPTPGEIDAFVADESPQAFEAVVDRLLSSRAFGERWARHWLDLTGYADMIGTSNNVFAEHAWRYRDYLIEAYHKDKPFDRFVREQIAGDLLPAESTRRTGREHHGNRVSDGRRRRDRGAGQGEDGSRPHRHAGQQDRDGVPGHDARLRSLPRSQVRSDRTDGLLRHRGYASKFARDAQDSVRSVEHAQFNGIARDAGATGRPSEARSRPRGENRVDESRAETDGREEDRRARNWRERERAGGRCDGHSRDRSGAEKTSTEDRSSACDKDDTHQSATNWLSRLRKLGPAIQHAEFFRSKAPQAFAMRDGEQPSDMPIYIRGNPYSPGAVVPRGTIQVASWEELPEIPRGQSGRLRLAGWMADRRNPLTARVMVNRIWQKLFGEGIVRSVDYFGARGETPSHPELLDHLATRFMQKTAGRRSS